MKKKGVTEQTFYEEQKVGRTVRRPLLLISLICWGAMIVVHLWNYQQESYSVLTIGLRCAGILFTVMYLLTLTTKFVTVVHDGVIDIRFLPFFKETILISSIVKMEISTYEVLGFGVRYRVADQITYYKASGNTGLYLTLSDNTTVVIGTSKAAQIAAFLTHLNVPEAAARPELHLIKPLKPRAATSPGQSS